jgi:hypothetical protein
VKFALSILGTEVLSVELVRLEPEPAPVYGPPFGFSGSAGLHAEIAPVWEDLSGSDGGSESP